MARKGIPRLNRNRQFRILRLGAVVAVLVAAWLIFEFGRIQAGYNIVEVASQRQALKDTIDELEKQVVALKEQIALLQTSRDIDQSAYARVETTLEELQRKVQEQREAIAFYRGIMAPADGGQGLRVQDLKVTKGKDEGSYRVSLVLVQVLQHDRQVQGDVAFSLQGAQDGESVSYTLEQLVPEDQDSAWPFSFRYFQTFEREVILPDGFTPEKVNIEVRSHTKSVASIEQSFDWQGTEG